MELPVKLRYSPELYTAVTSTLYAWYGIAGGAVQVGAALVVAFLAVRLRHSRSAGLALATAAAFIVSLLLWGALVSPVNSAWAEVSRTSPAELAAAYVRLRSRWEFGHLAAFIAWLTGWIGLVALASGQPVADQKRAA
jgi:hypothetical protein